jgi:EAL domain-containing protein (putative c-di-GMP-specific phosphodiesterase class I)/ActR/RegA family two-component response regulator
MNVELIKDDTKACVLVVDDEEVIRSVVSRILGEADFNVTAVKSAQEALSAIATKAFDAIVTDIVMPDIDGIELLAHIRQRDRELPVIILTGQPSLDSAVLAVREACFRYLKKPCRPEELCGAVREATAMYRLAMLKRRALEHFESGGWQTGELAKCSEQFNQALVGLWTAFQPIVHWPHKSHFGYEALVRTTGSALSNPGLLFGAAERLGRVHELGRRIRSLVAAAVPTAPTDAVIFVNLHAADLNDDGLFSSNAPLSQYATRVVLEVTERVSLEHVKDVQAKINELRRLGFRIAVDDLGAGYAGLSSFSQLEPDIVKLDMSLIRGIDSSSRKSSIVRSMIAVCARDLGTQVVCEGVETEAERDTLENLGATLLQGYLFGRPEQGFRVLELI